MPPRCQAALPNCPRKTQGMHDSAGMYLALREIVDQEGLATLAFDC